MIFDIHCTSSDQILVYEGKCQPIVDSVFAFDDVHKAYDRLMTSRAVGKVVVKIDPSAE